MVEQKALMVWDSTFTYFKSVKVEFQAKIKKELSDNEFIIELLKNLVNVERIKI